MSGISGKEITTTDTADEFDPFEAKDNLFGHAAISDPAPRFAELRQQCPVHQGSISSKFGVEGFDTILYEEAHQWSILGYAEADSALRRGKDFSSSYSSKPLREIIGRTILEMDAPDHYRYRMLIQPAFTKAEIDRWEHEFVRPIIAEYLERLAPSGRADLAKDFAFHYPIHVTAVSAGLPVDHIDDFYRQAVLLTNPAVDPVLRQAASTELGSAIQALIDERRREPGDDLISVLIQAEFRDAEGAGRMVLTDDEIVAFMRLLVPAGAQTTYRALTSVLHLLLTHPAELARLRANPSLIPVAIEEGLRLAPPLSAASRLASHDLDESGHHFETGDAVNISLLSANRDSARWPDPDEFSIDRPQIGHLSFGQGPHICLGIHAARMELRVAIEMLLERLPNLRFDPDRPPSGMSGLTYRTALSLPVVWDVEA
jgi:cytochrome P450